ncbi:hypothetical protein EDD86DRAFT_200729 [Gorgonomyces haynaldii]|nr:hypothetical protein EDD86DRAFT_200729 [Gorgonomyces haynaldii]
MRTGATKSEMSDAFMKVYETHKDGMIDSDLIKLRPEEKKKLDLRGKTYLAPLTTVGNIPFRRVCKGFGVDVTCGEMMLTNSLLSGSQSEWSLMRRHESEDIFGIQMTGADVPGFAQCCDFIQQQMDIDFLDINLGCPIDTVCKKGAGSTLLGRPTRLNHLCTAAVQILDCPVTVKIRTGIDEKNIAHKLLPIFQNSGVSAVTLHGRSKKQRYTKLANWEYMNECASILDRQKTQFIGNGDIFNPQEYHDRLKNTNVDAIMIGRGALIKPWIFTEIKENKLWDISSSERFDMLRKFCNFGLEYWGSDTKGVNQTRRYLCEWQSFLHRYVPVGIIETLPQQINIRPEPFVGRDDLETLMASPNAQDWVKLSEMLLGPAPESFHFVPKHKSNAYETNG